MKQVHAYIAGFEFDGTVDEMQNWWDGLKANYSFVGEELKVWVAKSSRGNARVYDSTPTKVYAI